MNREIHHAPFSRMIHAVVLILVIGLTAACSRSSRQRLVEWPHDPSYTAFDRVLAGKSTDDGFRYDQLAIDPSDLKIMKLEMAEVSQKDYEGFTRDAQLAFLINAHNVFALDRILRDYPVDSIEDTELLGSAIRARDYRLAGRKWSLLDLREEIMGPKFKESRAIFVLNWGMRGCAPLPPVAATEDNLDDLLEKQTQAFIRNGDYNEFQRRRRRFLASPLLETYREEIERDYTTLHLFLQRFSEPGMADALRAFPPRIAFQRFDTALNDYVEIPGTFPRESAAN
jgi:hypothetical protein